MKASKSIMHLLCLSLIQTTKTMATPTSIEAEEETSILEVADLAISIPKTSFQAHKEHNHREHSVPFMVRILMPSTSKNTIGQLVKSVERLDIMLLIAIIGWILLTNAKIHPPSLLQWPMPQISTSLKAMVIPGLLILVHLIT